MFLGIVPYRYLKTVRKMGNCAEEQGKEGLVSEIMRHEAVRGKDGHNKNAIQRALRGKSTDYLRVILKSLNDGHPLPDNIR
ncbi:MAG: hypothetical protein Q8P56_03380 [Candidatus Uhrbacteria bacterium]|nr:hypothetical protein [Candidatus Uhrbacteria bacterium]